MQLALLVLINFQSHYRLSKVAYKYSDPAKFIDPEWVYNCVSGSINGA